jgi:hypothetical protein
VCVCVCVCVCVSGGVVNDFAWAGCLVNIRERDDLITEDSSILLSR